MMKLFFSVFENRTRYVAVLLPVFILAIIFYLVSMGNVSSETYDIERFSRAKATIQSPITVENEIETNRKMFETIQSVSDRYTISESITEERINYIDEIFDALDKIKVLNKELPPEKNDEVEGEKVNRELTFDEISEHLQDVLSPEITSSINEFSLMRLNDIESKERKKAKEIFIQAAEKVLQNGVRTENMQSAKSEVKDTLKYSELNESVKDVFIDLINFTIVENSFYDAEKTATARNEAASNVNPVLIRAGDIIVREGQIITNEMYEDLKLVGLLKQQKNIYPITGLVILVLLLVSIVGYELNRLYKRNQLNSGKTLSVIIISLIVVATMKTISLFSTELNYLYLIVPIAAGPLLLKALLYERTAIVFSIIYSVLASVVFNNGITGSLNVEVGIYFLFFQLASIIFISNLKDGLAILKATLGIAIINVMTIALFLLLSFRSFHAIDFLTHAGYGITGAVIAVVLTVGLLPFFETGMGVLSDSKLLLLANPNQPLIKKILTEVPGTYHHSVMVANLSEAACEAIGAHGLLARVGAYYHDIGKAVKPHYFIENQVGIRNPHDMIGAKESAKIIINHVIDGAEMLRQHNLPKEIIDIAKQHHGTSLVAYFYHQAKEIDPSVSEADFRYTGPKPQTKEVAIISICDSAEAAVRSLKEPSPEKIEEILNSIVNNKLMDGQFDETPLTLKEIKIVQETICEALKGIFHSRIQYPKEEK